ncbi:unnamed protein product [Urochloa humidicola]
MEVDDSSQQPFVPVGSGWRHVEVRSEPARQGNYYSRRSQGKDDQVEPEAPIHVFYTEPGDAIFGLKEVKAGDALQPEPEAEEAPVYRPPLTIVLR